MKRLILDNMEIIIPLAFIAALMVYDVLTFTHTI